MSSLSQVMPTGDTSQAGAASRNFGFLAKRYPLLVHKVFEGELEQILRDIADAVWRVAA